MANTVAALPAPGRGVPGTLKTASGLPRRAKAAIVVRFLLNDGADIALEDLPEDLQAILTHQMGAMRLVSRDIVETVIDEFTAELEAVGLSFPGGIAGALDALDGRISAHTANRLRDEAGVKRSGNPWDRICTMPVEKLKPVFETESPEVCAVVLSKMEVPQAAELLGQIPGPLARQITYAVSQTSAVTPEAVDLIGLSLATQLDAIPVTAFQDGPVQRVSAILNSSTSATRDDMLSGLDETDEAFANEVRKSIFTFVNIPERLSPRDVPAVLRGVDQAQVVAALAAANASGLENVSEFIFSNMSARLADQIKDEIQELGEVSAADGEAAMSAVVTSIREMESAGEIFLVVPETGDDAD